MLPASSRVAEGVIFKQNKKLLGCFPSSLPQQPADLVFASLCGGGACDDQSVQKSVLSRYTMCFVSLKERDPIYTKAGNLEYHPTIWTRLQGNS